MLLRLSLKNLATISDTTLELGGGLNVLSGETGAGKSILIDGLLLALGQRADTSMVRPGQSVASAEAHFRAADENGEIIVRREVYSAGRSRIFLDDRLTNLEEVREAVEAIIDLHSQRTTPALLSRRTQQSYLDEYSGTSELAAGVRETFQSYREMIDRRNELAPGMEALEDEKDLLSSELGEIDAVRPSEEEYRSLLAERKSLQKAADQAGVHRRMSSELSGEPESISGRLRDLLGEATRAGSGSESLIELLQQALVAVDEAAGACDRYLEDVEQAPWRMEEIDQRLDSYSRLLARCGGDIGHLMGRRRELAGRLQKMEALRKELRELVEKRIPAAESKLARDVEKLSRMRRKGAARLVEHTVEELRRLGMDDARFEVEMSPPPRDRSMEIGGLSVCSDGGEVPRFLFSANPGVPVGPLSSIASGGELSRFSLSLRLALAELRRQPTLVFDEIDSGVGGQTAHLLADSLRRAAGPDRQVVVITHLAQIASLADTHLAVAKQTREGMPVTTVRALGPEDRVDEITRILGGGDAAREHAIKMLSGRKG